MISRIDTVTLYSEDASKLADFYINVVGLKTSGEFVMGEEDDGDNVYMFELENGSDFAIIDHSEVTGKNLTPQRFMVNFEVDDIEKEVKRLKDKKVKIIAEIYHVENYGWIATLEDPDGNYFQLVQVRPNE